MNKKIMKDKKLTIDYIAGLFDGEGSISLSTYLQMVTAANGEIRKHICFTVHLRITQKNPEILYKVQEYFGCGDIQMDYRTGVHNWTIRRWKQSKKLMDILYPHLFIKKDEAEYFYKIYDINKNKGINNTKAKIEILKLIGKLRKMRRNVYVKYDVDVMIDKLEKEEVM